MLQTVIKQNTITKRKDQHKKSCNTLSYKDNVGGIPKTAWWENRMSTRKTGHVRSNGAMHLLRTAVLYLSHIASYKWLCRRNPLQPHYLKAKTSLFTRLYFQLYTIILWQWCSMWNITDVYLNLFHRHWVCIHSDDGKKFKYTSLMLRIFSKLFRLCFNIMLTINKSSCNYSRLEKWCCVVWSKLSTFWSGAYCLIHTQRVPYRCRRYIPAKHL
jgi:hypothetical protein